MTLLHHVAFAGNLEALHEIAKLPYFGEVVDENANEVRLSDAKCYVGRVDTAALGCYQETHGCGSRPGRGGRSQRPQGEG